MKRPGSSSNCWGRPVGESSQTTDSPEGNAIRCGRTGGRVDIDATLACLGALVFWSVGPIFIKYLSPFVDAWTQNALRYTVGCLFWLPLLAVAMRKGTFDRRLWKAAIIPSVANVIMQSLWATAFYFLKPAFMTMLLKTNVLWVAAFSLAVFPRERVLVRSKRFWTGLGLSVAGVAGVLCFKPDFSAQGTGFGIFLTMIAAVMWAAYVLAARMAFSGTDSRHSMAVVTIYTVAGLWVLAGLFGDVGRAANLTGTAWAVVVVSGITSISLAHALYYAAMRRIGATLPALIVLAQPFLVLAISYFMFDESLVPLQLLSGLVLLVGSAIAIWAQEHLGRAPTDPKHDSEDL